MLAKLSEKWFSPQQNVFWIQHILFCLDFHQSKEGQHHCPSFSDLNPWALQLFSFLQKHRNKPGVH
jgi:hypothetical protein